MNNQAIATEIIDKALAGADITPADREKLIALALEEAEHITQNGEVNDLKTLIKQVRLSGELPVYLSKLAALSFGKNGAKPEELEAVAEKGLGFSFERETIVMVAEAIQKLPDLGLDEKSLEKAELMKLAHRKGYEFEKTYRGCAQCTYAAAAEVTGKFNDEMFRAANGFAAGMASMGDGVCGGYSGGLMSLGMLAGRRHEFFDGDKPEKDLIGLLAAKLREKFIKTYGTVICHGIHCQIFGRKFNITEEADKVAFEEAGAHSLDKCPSVVGMASAWTAEILFEQGLIDGKPMEG